MQTVAVSSLVLFAFLYAAASAAPQPTVGALAVDERQGDQWGWAVDYETAGAAQQRALSECGSNCSVVLTFARCAAYAADQDSDSTAVGWAESYGSASAAQQAALSACSSRGGGSGCVVRVWGCNGPVVEEGLGLDRAARQEVQRGLRSAGFDPGGADGMFGPRTRAAIRRWQSSRGSRATGYLDGSSVAALRSSGPGQTTFRQRPAAGAREQPSSPPPPAATAEQENLFWQSVANSSDAADFEAYLEQFPNGVFRRLAENRLSALRSSPGVAAGASGRPSGATGSRAAGSRVSGASSPGFGGVSDPGYRPGDAFRDCDDCPEMVVMPGGRLALGRYEVTVGEYRAFVSTTGGGAAGGCRNPLREDDRSWRDPGFSQTDNHPVTCLIWDDAQAYVSWLSRTTGATYRLPTAAEWRRAAVGSPSGCGARYQLAVDRREATCPVGSYGSNRVDLSDMGGNVSEWLEDCWENRGNWCAFGGSGWDMDAEYQHISADYGAQPDSRSATRGVRVAKTLGGP